MFSEQDYGGRAAARQPGCRRPTPLSRPVTLSHQPRVGEGVFGGVACEFPSSMEGSMRRDWVIGNANRHNLTEGRRTQGAVLAVPMKGRAVDAWLDLGILPSQTMRPPNMQLKSAFEHAAHFPLHQSRQRQSLLGKSWTAPARPAMPGHRRS